MRIDDNSSDRFGCLPFPYSPYRVSNPLTGAVRDERRDSDVQNVGCIGGRWTRALFVSVMIGVVRSETITRICGLSFP